MRDTERQREKQAPCKELDVGLDPGSRDHALGRRQMLNPGVPVQLSFIYFDFFKKRFYLFIHERQRKREAET